MPRSCTCEGWRQHRLTLSCLPQSPRFPARCPRAVPPLLFRVWPDCLRCPLKSECPYAAGSREGQLITSCAHLLVRAWHRAPCQGVQFMFPLTCLGSGLTTTLFARTFSVWGRAGGWRWLLPTTVHRALGKVAFLGLDILLQSLASWPL